MNSPHSIIQRPTDALVSRRSLLRGALATAALAVTGVKLAAKPLKVQILRAADVSIHFMSEAYTVGWSHRSFVDQATGEVECAERSCVLCDALGPPTRRVAYHRAPVHGVPVNDLWEPVDDG